jgi:hypothetical protein
MKTFWCWIFVVVLLLTAIDGGNYFRNNILSISSGTTGRLCHGYCIRSINITKTPMKLTTLKQSYSTRTEYPTVTKQYPYSLNQWEKLINLVNPNDFLALPHHVQTSRKILDSPNEWIQINWRDTEKKVSFEYREIIEGFEELINQLRSLRDQYLNTERTKEENITTSQLMYKNHSRALTSTSCFFLFCLIFFISSQT